MKSKSALSERERKQNVGEKNGPCTRGEVKRPEVVQIGERVVDAGLTAEKNELV